MTSVSIICLIIDKLGYWLEPGPIILLEIEKDLEIDLHAIVLPFYLAIS